MEQISFYTGNDIRALLYEQGITTYFANKAISLTAGHLSKRDYFKIGRKACYSEDAYKSIQAKAIELQEYHDKNVATPEKTKGLYTARDIDPKNPQRALSFLNSRGFDPVKQLVRPDTNRWINYYGKDAYQCYVTNHTEDERGKMVTDELNRDIAELTKQNHVLRTMLEAKDIQIQGKDKTIDHLKDRIDDLESQINRLTDELDGVVGHRHSGKLVKFRKVANQ